MNKILYNSLVEKAYEVARLYSKTNRAYNFNNETFEVHEIYPMSDTTAAVHFKKNTGKIGAGMFYAVRDSKEKIGYKWKYFFPTDVHILGMINFNFYKLRAEEINRKFNEPKKNGNE